MNQPIFGGGLTESLIHPFVAVCLLITILLILALPRKHVVAPVLLSLFLIPLGQQVYFGGVHWLAPRIIILAGLARAAIIGASSRGVLRGRLDRADKYFVTYVISEVFGFVLQYSFRSEAVTQQFGILIDLMGGYFLMRILIEDQDAVYRALKWMAVIAGVIAIGMVLEQTTLQNIFGLLGGTRLQPEIREGKIRSQGVFQHSIIAGVFGATLIPLFIMLWKHGRQKALALIGLVSATLITICSNSSTPLLAYAAGIAGMALWPLRKHMQTVRRALTGLLISLHLVMKAPVWFLIARIDLTGGSSGYHRAELVDQFIKHLGDWWMIGTSDAGSWGDDMWDQQNQYVNVGETGGLLALMFFIAMIVRHFGLIGRARKALEGTVEESMPWFLGAALFSNAVAFFGANYFDQSKMSWFMLLAMIIATTGAVPTQPVLPGHDGGVESDAPTDASFNQSHRGDWSTVKL